MPYRYEATEKFWRSFYDLSDSQKESVRRAWKIFKLDPFDPRLGTHKIHRLLINLQKLNQFPRRSGLSCKNKQIAGMDLTEVRRSPNEPVRKALLSPKASENHRTVIFIVRNRKQEASSVTRER